MRSAARCFCEADLAVPVPLHPNRLRSRGFNQAALLCRAALRGILPVRCGLLFRVRDTPAQTELGPGERWSNVQGAFVASPKVKGRSVLLVDDVTTTGATACACAEALVGQGADEVHLLTLARAMP
jgi:ComF family protein